MKKIIILLSVLCISIITLSCTACNLGALFNGGPETIEVSTLSELTAYHRDDNIKLMNDIDGEFETINAISCLNFDGQGHTIKNIVISTPDAYATASLFEKYVASIKDVNLDNINVAGVSCYGAIVNVIGCDKIENVHVTNSKLTCGQTILGSGLGRHFGSSYCGGIYGGVYDDGAEKDTKCEIINCSVSDTKIELVGAEDASIYTNYGELYVGGIAGWGNSISNCNVQDCEIICTSKSTYSNPIVGGITAYTEGSITNCYTKDTTLTADAKYYKNGSFSYYSTSSIYVGGILGRGDASGEIRYSFSQGNTINGKSTGDVSIGGLVGEIKKLSISQSFTNDNIIKADNYAEGNKNNVARALGGLVGVAENASITSTFAVNNHITDATPPTSSNSLFAAGLIANASATTINYSATYGNQLSAGKVDEFCTFSLSTIYHCYVTSENEGNINSCEILTEETWLNPDLIKSSLMLNGIYWVFSTKSLPTLVFN